MRLCPSNAIRAKEFFWTIYGEEQGRFVIERNHATVFKRFCNAIGIDDQTLEREYEGYWPNFRYLLTEPPSTTAVVRELAISYAWESAIATIADPLGATVVRLQNELEVASEDLRYFSDHLVIDESHAERALSALTTYLADDDLIRFALSSIHRTLIDENPWRLTLVAKEASSHSSSLLM
jgi:pyrroloquinoline quinone (PQQ) biosynthesis protein C